MPVEHTKALFFDSLNEWLEGAEIEQVSRLRSHIDLAITMKGDQIKADEAELKRKKAAQKAAMKALGIKRKYKPRKKKTEPSADQVTE